MKYKFKYLAGKKKVKNDGPELFMLTGNKKKQRTERRSFRRGK